jgi:hypothetical protein
MSTISTVAVDFVANTGKYTTGLDGMAKKTKVWSDKTKGEAKGVTAAFDNTTKSVTNLAKGLVGLVAIQRVGAAFANAAAQVSLLADEAEKVGASAEQFDKLRLAAERNGSELGDVKIAYKELQKSINEALGGTRASIDAFRSLGLSYSYLASLNADQRFLAVADSLSKISDENERARLGVLLLGKAYTELSPLIAKGATGIETGGRGGLSNEQIQTIDKVTKSFEELSRTLDVELKKALVAISPFLIASAKLLTVIAENSRLLIISLSALGAGFLALKGVKVFNLAQAALESRILKNVVAMEGMATTTLLTGKAFRTTTPVMIKYTEVMVSVAAAGQKAQAVIALTLTSLQAYALPAVAAMALLVAQIYNFIEAISDIPKLGGYLFPKLKPEFDSLSERVDIAKNRLYGFIAALAAATKAAAQGKPIGSEFIGPRELTPAQKILAEATSAARKAADLASEATAQAIKDTDDYVVSLINLGKTLNDQFGNPLDVAEAKLIKYTNAVDIGTISFEAYKKAVAEVMSTLSGAEQFQIREKFGTGPLDALAAPLGNKAGPNDPRGLIGSSKTPLENFIPDFSKGSSLALVNLANINSAVGGVADSYNTAGENALKFTIAADKAFSDSKLKTFSTVKSELDALRFVDIAERLKGSAGADAKTVFEKQVEDINMAAMAVDKYGNSIMSAADKTLALDNATEQYGIASAEAFRKSNEEMYNIVMLTEDFASSLAGAIAAGQSFGEALKNVFQDITKQIIAMILRSIILQSILQAIGVVTGGVGSVAATTFASMMNIKPMAAGGPVKGGTPYQVGELGPELFVPEGNGYIVPNNMMGGESTQVVQNIYVQTGVAQTVRAEMLALLPQFRTQAVNAVLETKQRGGSFSKGMTFA